MELDAIKSLVEHWAGLYMTFWLVPIKMGRTFLTKRLFLQFYVYEAELRNNGERLKFLPNAKKSWQPVIIGKLSVFSLRWCLEAALDSSHNWPKKISYIHLSCLHLKLQIGLRNDITKEKFLHTLFYLPRFGAKKSKISNWEKWVSFWGWRVVNNGKRLCEHLLVFKLAPEAIHE